MMLKSGEDFRSLIPDDVKSILFTDCTPPSDVRIIDMDLYDENDGCVGWYTGDKMFVVSSRFKGEKMFANYDCSHMLSDFPNLEAVDFSFLDTSLCSDFSNAFRNSKALKALDLSNLDLSGVSNLDGFIKGCDNLRVLDIKDVKFTDALAEDDQRWKDWCHDEYTNTKFPELNWKQSWNEQDERLKPHPLAGAFGWGERPMQLGVIISKDDEFLKYTLQNHYMPEEKIEYRTDGSDSRVNPGLDAKYKKLLAEKAKLEKNVKKLDRAGKTKGITVRAKQKKTKKQTIGDRE